MNRVYIERSGLSTGAYYFVGLFFVPVIALFLWGLYQQIIIGEPIGNKPTSDSVLIGISIGVITLCLGIIWLMTSIKAEIRIADKTISLRFPPFLNKEKTLSLEEVKQWAVIKKKLWASGIGLRYDMTRGVTIYSTGSKYFLALELVSGKKLMISTQRPDRLKKSIELAQTKSYE